MNLTKVGYTLTDAAQREEIAAGREGGKYREVEVDLSTHAVEAWVEVDADGDMRTICREEAAINRNTIAAPQESVLSADRAADILAAEMRAYMAGCIQWPGK